MSTSENAKLQYEAGQTFVAMEELSDSGDQTSFNSVSTIMSDKAGFEPVLRPNGLITGGVVTIAASGSNDVVDVSALTCYLIGVSTSVNASTDLAITRATSTDTHMINSITVNAGGALAVVTGTDHASAFSETRGADGGPPLIPVGSIEIAQVRTDSFTAAALVAGEIFQVVGQHLERYDFPTFEEKKLRVSSQVMGLAGLDFTSALPLSHTGAVPKKVYAEYYTPIFADLSSISDFVPAETSHTANSQTIYGGAIASKSSSLNQCTFTAYLDTGISDALVTLKDAKLWFKYFQNRLNSTPYVLTNGFLGIGRTFPADNQNQSACTVTAEKKSEDVTI